MPSKRRSEVVALDAIRAAAQEWALPSEPYIPGSSPRPPDDDTVHQIAAMAPNPTDPDGWRENAAYLAGIRLYENRYCWEAHEVWEPVWMNARTNSPERHLVQGLIQLANSRLKCAMKNDRAALRLAVIAKDCFREASYAGNKTVMGVDIATLLPATHRLCDMLANGSGSNFPVTPISAL